MNLSRFFPAAVFAALICASPAVAQGLPLPEPVIGPKLICFKYSSFSLAKGERITHFGGGMESMGLHVQSPRGSYNIGESEIFATPRLGRLMSDRDGTRVYRLKTNSREYAVAGATDFSDDRDNVIVRLDGDAFTGGQRDERIYRRFKIGDPVRLDCVQTFTYGWFIDDSN